ncbi:MAG: beta strand repeat-containing protein, partial [Aquirufa sp.]
MSASSGTFTPISGGNALSTLSADEAITPATEIGFTFKYLNRTYTKFFVSSNGYVSFQSVTGASTTLTTVNKPVIAPLIGDLSGVGGTASYIVTGTAPNRVLTVEWLNWKWLFNNTTATISMQVKLYETSGKIEFIYNPGAGTPNGAANAGLAGSSTINTATFGFLSNLTSSATFGTTATATTTKPVAGQMFTFTPPAGVVTMLSQPIESKTIYTNDAPFTLTATASGAGTLSYQWEQTTDGGITWANAAASSVLTGVTTNALTITKPTATYAGYGYRLKVTSSSSSCPAYSNPSYLNLYNGSIINAGGGGTNNTHDLKIHIGNTGQIQVVKTNISQVFDPLYFPAGPSNARNYNGIFLTVGTNYFGPVSNWSGTPVEFTPISHSGGSANGSGNDELVLKATTGGLDYFLYITYTYVYPNPYVNINYRLVVPQGNTQRVKLWHGIDTYLQGGDNGPAYIQGVAPYYSMGVKKDPSFEAFRYRSGLPWSGYYSGTYTTMNTSYIRTATNFPNTLDYTSTTDNGIGWMYDGGANTAPGEYVTNSDLVFELDPAPTFSVQPVLTPVKYCTNATSTPLTVTVSNATSFQWYRNTTNSNTGGTLIQGATSTTYTPPTNTPGTNYYYCVASSTFDNIPSTVSGAVIVEPCTTSNDHDSDGLLDQYDIDDDNDGVLDAIESPSCFFAANEWNTASKSENVFITSQLNTLSPNTNFSALTDGVSATAAVQFATASVQSQNGVELFKMEFASPVQLDAIYIKKTNATQIFATTASSLMLQGSNDNGTWTNLLTTAIASPADATNMTANGSISLTNSNKFTVGANANKYKFYRIFGVGSSTANILSGIASEFYFDVNSSYNPSFFPKSTCSNDTDSDGILNHFDLDSDGDGCSDMIESGSSTNTSTSTYPTGSDANANGLLTSYESNTAGVINYISTYIDYALSNSFNLCLDSDGDSVSDVYDLDDDNDGILDVTEMNCASTLMPYDGVIISKPNSINYTFNGTYTLDNLIDGVDNNTYVLRSPTGTLNGEWFRIQLPNLKVLNYVEIGHYSGQTLFTVGSTYKVEGSIDGVNWTNISGTLTYNNQVKSVNGGYSNFNSNTAVFNNNTAYFYYRLVGINAVSGGTWATELYFKQRDCSDIDTDEDGIPNRLELDSDGDGCSDAKEAGTTSSTSANYAFTGSFGGNGFADALETASESGIFSGTYTYNFASNPQINACSDNDSDGVLDFFDIDDDNDGVLDAAETLCTLYTYTGSNTSITIPAGTTSIDVKMWGAGGGGSNTSNSTAGSGAYVFGKLSVTPNETLTLIVGQGGINKSSVATFGGGGAGGNDPFQSLHGGSGGGRSELRRGTTSLLIAGGGGGAAGSPTNTTYAGGAGIRQGQDGIPNAQVSTGAGKGGTQSAGGLGGTILDITGFNGSNGAQYVGGNGGVASQSNAGAGGGGGGGWYGGGGGAGNGFGNYQESAAGGGSSYFNGILLQKLGIPGNTNRTGGSTTAAPNNTDPVYVAGVGTGGAANAAGGNGLVQICYSYDTDGDGVANQFDLDSDGDGCSDAFEAGSVSAPSNTSTIPTGTDTNGNGLLNNYEGTTAGTINYTSRYAQYALNAQSSACLDSDTDGIPDVNDIDDDNDGVLDTIECPANAPYSLYTYNYPASSIASNVPVNITGSSSLDVVLDQRTNGVDPNTFTFNSISNWKLVATNIKPSLTNTITVKITPTASTAATYVFADAMLITNGTNTYVIDNNATNTGGFNLTGTWSQQNVSNAYLGTNSYLTSPAYLGNTATWTFTIPTPPICDTDGDGIINSLDLDADGDGCPDTKEAGITTSLTSAPVVNKVGTVTSSTTIASAVISGTFGANGFANSIETTSESGLYSGTYTYGFATDVTVSACLDTDTDGVVDILDLDDDNDGVLDTVECPMTNIITNGGFDGGTAGWTANANWGWSAGYVWNSADNVSNNVISQTFTKPIFNPESSTQEVSFDVNTNGTGWSITSAGTATMDVSINNVVYATITNPSGGTTASVVAKNGANTNVSSINIVTTNVPSTKIVLSLPKSVFTNSNTISFSFSATTDDIGIDNVYVGSLVGTCDTDGDGRINSKDIDSDGDGCPDAVEAGTTYTSSSGVLSANKLTASIIPAPYGNNGFADGLETVAESGLYTGTYTYIFATDPAGSACLDTDSDGLADIYDIDDDNDGVLDTVECPLTNILVNGGFTGNTTGWTANANWVWNTGNFVWNSADNVSNNVISQTFAKPIFDAEAITEDVAFDFNTNGVGWSITSAGTATMDVSINNVVYATLTNPSGGTTASVVAKNGATINVSSVNIVTDNIPTTRIVFKVPKSIFNASNTIAFSFSATTDDIGIDNVFVGTKVSTCDTDGDGIPNSKDLDSDGDGCYDAVEAKTVTSLLQSTVTGQYGDNGFADSKETFAESGIYSGTYVYSRATDPTIKGCTDTDFDGVPDIDDLDDDNDGIQDTAECPVNQLNTNESNGTFGTAAAPRNTANTTVSGGYVYSSTNTAAAQYAIINQNTAFFTASTAFWRYPGHTTGSATDAYLAVNGSTTVGTFYAETVNLQATVKYRISFWHAAASAANDYALVAELVNGSGTTLATASTGAQNSLGWKLTTIDYTSPSNQALTFKIKNTSINANGNDFSIDDISITPVGCPDTDGDGIPNQLDLDSDGDGCSDANEAYNSSTAQGTDGNSYYGTGTPPAIDGNGKVTGASYATPNANVLTVGQASVITTQPADVTTVPGSTNITYSATVTPGSGTTSYQWQLSTNGGGTWTNITNNATYTGATTATLIISATTIAMKEYRYRLNIAQSDFICGNLTSSAARLIMSNTPTVTDDVATAIEDTPLNSSVLTNDSGSGGSAITVTSFTINGTTYTAGQTATLPNVGTFVMAANGSYTFTPAANYNGAVPVISYLATDANGGSDTGDLSISITAINDPVVVVNETVSTNQGTNATGNVLTNDTDADGNTLTVTQFTVSGVAYNVGDVVSIPGKGTITVAANGTYTFTPIASYSGSVPVIGYTVSDGNGSSVNGTLTITVVDVNDAPLAADDITTTLQNTPVSGNVLTNDSDPENNTLSITKITIGGVDYPAGTSATIANVGTVVVNANGTYTFTPTSNFTGAAPVITYTVSDGTATSTADLKIAVTAIVNANPVAVADTKTTTEDTPASGNVLTNDTDAEGNTLSLTSFTINGVTYPAGTTATIAGVGTLVVNANGTYTFTSLTNYAGAVPVISYAISDGNGGTANGTLTVSITPANDAPVATDDVATATEDSPVSGNVLTNDSDVEGNTLSVTQFVINGTTYPAGQTATLAGVGTFVINANGTFTFTPEANYSGAVPTATYTLSDGNGATDTGDLTVNITPVNDAPVASDDTATTPQGSVKTGDIVTGADTDLEGNALTLTQFKINGVTYAAGSTANIPGVGTLQINADGTYTFTPLAAYVGTVPTVEYTISDGNGGT